MAERWALGEHDVGRLEVAVNDADSMRRCDSRNDRKEHLGKATKRDCSFLGEERREIRSLEKLHDDEREPFVRANVEDFDDVLVSNL